MNSVGKLPKRAGLFGELGPSSFLNQCSVRWAMSSASGSMARIWSRFSAVSGSLTPPGTTHAGWMRLPPSISMIVCPICRRRMPSRASSRMLGACTPKMLRLAGSAVHPQQQIRAGQVEEAQRMGLHDLRQVHHPAQLRRPSAGSRTASSCVARLGGRRSDGSPGRCRRCGPSATAFRVSGRPSQNFSKPAELGHVEHGIVDLPCVVQLQRDLRRGLRCG